jgi:hypothetical protein
MPRIPILPTLIALILITALQSVPQGVPTGRFLASIVGVGASVEPNPYNTAAAQIDAKQAELARREMELSTREALRDARSDILLATVAFLSLALAYNYWRDMKRERRVA